MSRKVNNKILNIISVIFLFFVPLYSQDEDDTLIRENPDIGDMPATLVTSNYSSFPFLKLRYNHVNLNGADWSKLYERFQNSDDTVISVVHIGDSHIQAEGSTSRTRTLLQHRYGNAGRGLIIPFKLAGTNQPLDYKIQSNTDFLSARAIKRPWSLEMGFTGVAIQPKNKFFDFSISVESKDGQSVDFDFIRMFTNGKMPSLKSVTSSEGKRTVYDHFVVGDTLTVFLYEPQEFVNLNFETNGACQIYGFELQNQMTGLVYHAIGNNGATYNTYASMPNFGRDLKSLSPNLLIISLGTNEAFGKIADETFYSNIHRLVSDIKDHNPEASILLTTPSECQRSHSVRKGKGKRRRTIKSYSVNDNVVRLRNVILRYGRDHQVPTYDWYEVAGGVGSSNHWLEHNLMKSDRIHNTWDGYSLMGSLFYDALYETFSSQNLSK